MKRFYFAFLILFGCPVYSQQFPAAKKIPNTVTRHKISLTDDYSWLEQTESPETISWIDAENIVTEEHLAEIKKTWSPAGKIKEYDYLSTNPLPIKKGRYFYALHRIDKNKPGCLFFRKSLNEKAVELVNPAKIYKDDNVVISGIYPSSISKYVAFLVTTNGSDKKEIHFADVANLSILPDRVIDVKFSGVEWKQNDGIFYKRTRTASRFARDSTYQLFYHRIGDLQENDALIFDTTASEGSISFFTKENKLFITEVSKDERVRNYYYANLNESVIKLEKYLADDTSGFHFLEYNEGRIYFSSDEFDWGEIRSFNMKNRSDETVIVPQIYMQLLMHSWFEGGYIFCKYKNGGNYLLRIYDASGNFIRKFDIPYSMDFDFKFFNPETKDIFVTLSSYVISYQNFRLNIETGRADSYYNDYIKPKSTIFPLDYFETRHITYKSRDNKDIPITIIHKKGLVFDGRNPTLLTAYGGFGAVSSPTYNSGLLYFLEKGGVYANAGIRGGGDKGLKWHNEGRKKKKINTFNDFIDAAEFLIKEKYTSPAKLAITGASHGGLVVGAAVTMRPDLFKVAVPVVGKFDMFKSDLFAAGKYQLDEYGNPDKEDEFAALIAYSPYNNICEDVNYPTMLIQTSEYDDRVPPFHSYKFAAKLQNRPAQKNPVYLLASKKAGHSGKNTTYTDRVNEKATLYSFILYHLTK
ncbi:MAG TPA: prolyl oligopeptidase family serine peptidase [Flavobacterium sp.]